jgi:hypothetical protein
MKNKEFEDLLKSIDQARAIHRGESKSYRVIRGDANVPENVVESGWKRPIKRIKVKGESFSKTIIKSREES